MANTKRFTDGLPADVRALIVALGGNLKLARRRRRMSIAKMAELVMVSPPTLRKIESGDPTVSLGATVTALWVLGLSDGLRSLAAPETDEIGLRADLQRLSGRGARKRGGDDLDF